MIIYRFENPCGRGPWRGGGEHAYNAKQRHDKWHLLGDMPSLGMDVECDSDAGKLHDDTQGDHGLYFAFETKEQIEAAAPCPHGREALHLEGCRLSIFRVDRRDVHLGNTQCLFDRPYAKKIGELNPVTLEEEYWEDVCTSGKRKP